MVQWGDTSEKERLSGNFEKKMGLDKHVKTKTDSWDVFEGKLELHWHSCDSLNI